MLSKNFTEWALALNPMERVLVTVAAVAAPKRNESLKEFFLNRSTL